MNQTDHKVPLCQQVWEDDTPPLVSINCAAFNHSEFIQATLEGFLCQETNFKVEILIHDDASTDGTSEIIRSYEDRFPGIIHGIYQSVNQYSKGNKPSRINRDRSKGKYIALCEGDDYWTDPQKLQIQVDFLEAHPDLSLCYHSVVISDGRFVENFSRDKDVRFSFVDSLRLKQGSTLSMVYRRMLLDETFQNLIVGLPIGDWPLEAYLLTKGDGYYFSAPMGFYRKHHSGQTMLAGFRRKSIQTKMVFLSRLLKVKGVSKRFPMIMYILLNYFRLVRLKLNG
ncbi:MAG: glycosyltransferase [Lunatimonas sp.]|uniref:glycosyltransferase n=1 Tax=Lunatimonas sp. TaxID=2060141 RepID=UPI00263B511D|nr:glycosyltransferase [Lunatimonas sp.]MCC5937199.1 glycosyltransferase [Lunatimonas sp.]